jgi:hypothetical protein
MQSMLEGWHKDSTSKVVPIKADVSIPAKQYRKPEKKLDPEVDLAPDGNPLPEILPGETTDEFLARLGLI